MLQQILFLAVCGILMHVPRYLGSVASVYTQIWSNLENQCATENEVYIELRCYYTDHLNLQFKCQAPKISQGG